MKKINILYIGRIILDKWKVEKIMIVNTVFCFIIIIINVKEGVFFL